MSVYHEVIPARDPRLRRHVHHDDRSWQHRVDVRGLALSNVVHQRHIGILDQGQVGSCVGNATIGNLATDPVWPVLPSARPFFLDEDGALWVYSAAETLDGSGAYPPVDVGTSGLSAAKVVKARGLIANYEWAFSAAEALTALAVRPFLFGTNWYRQMFTPDPDGRVRIGGPVDGGHELLCRELDADRGRVWLDNSWSPSWGVDGRCYLTYQDFDRLMGERGDVVFFTPLSVPAPVPPTPPAPPAPANPDDVLAAAARPWVARRHLCPGDRRMATALRQWLKETGR